MAAFLLDHNVSAALAVLLRRAGHDVAETREVGKARATDDELLLIAASLNRIFITYFITYNEGDYVLLHDAWRRWSAAWGILVTHPGIIVLPQPPRLANAHAARELVDFLTAGAEVASGLYSLRPSGEWRRRQ
jgi:hypothetical protein